MLGSVGKTVIVTGGSKGIGYAIALAFLEAGATVYICGRRPPQNLPAADDNAALFIMADVRDPEQSQSLIDAAIEGTGRIDVLVNNAGGSPPVESKHASANFVESVIRLNLIAPMVLAQQAYVAMSGEGGHGGSIINIASVSGTRASPGTAAYGAAKAGLINVTQSLAQEWGVNDIRVNTIIAGLVRTQAAEEHYGGEDGIKLIEDKLPMRRMAKPSDIANACLFLASEDSNYISGAALDVSGGGEPPSFLDYAEMANKLKDNEAN